MHVLTTFTRGRAIGNETFYWDGLTYNSLSYITILCQIDGKYTLNHAKTIILNHNI